MADRRSDKRFEIVGRLRGSLAADEHVRVHNLSPSGALVETAEAWVVGSMHTVRIAAAGGDVATLGARVQHVRPLALTNCYLVGLEFMPSGAAVENETLAVLLHASSNADDAEPI